MTIDLDDVQGNILRGYGLPDVWYLAISLNDVAGGRSLIGALLDGSSDFPAVETAQEWGERPTACVNVSFSHRGLAALGVPRSMLDAFPPAYKNGSAYQSWASAWEPDVLPYHRGVGIGDVHESAPENWVLGGPKNPETHMLLSVFTNEEHTPRRAEIAAAIRELVTACSGVEVWSDSGHTFAHNGIHFGYRDGISQPQIEGAPGSDIEHKQPQALTGDFLLGRGYRNIYGGNYLGAIPASLGDNGTYLAFRVLQQDVAAFEKFIALTGERFHMEPELVAAKMVGRWRDGTPLALSPNESWSHANEFGTPPHAHPDQMSDDQLNDFDHAATAEHPGNFDDFNGARCPFGAHMRRMNPRGGPVMGIQNNRRIIRRGVPYGPAIDKEKPDDGIERGLLGAFICGDLEYQFEFLQTVWANTDIAAPGIRGSRDPIIGWQPENGGRLSIPSGDTRGVMEAHDVPRLVTTRGSLYTFMPGIGGLRSLAGGSF